MNSDHNNNASSENSRHEQLKVILMSTLWLVFFALSFLTYYAVPAVILVTWAIIAWVIKASKGDQDSGSGYDREF